jgi:hypothetical protein
VEPNANLRPRVFISYSQDSDAHITRVRALADELRDDVSVYFDQYETDPPQGLAPVDVATGNGG